MKVPCPGGPNVERQCRYRKPSEQGEEQDGPFCPVPGPATVLIWSQLRARALVQAITFRGIHEDRVILRAGATSRDQVLRTASRVSLEWRAADWLGAVTVP